MHLRDPATLRRPWRRTPSATAKRSVNTTLILRSWRRRRCNPLQREYRPLDQRSPPVPTPDPPRTSTVLHTVAYAAKATNREHRTADSGASTAMQSPHKESPHQGRSLRLPQAPAPSGRSTGGSRLSSQRARSHTRPTRPTARPRPWPHWTRQREARCIAAESSLYGGTGARQFTDLDVLLAPDDLPTARTVLTELGYHISSPEATMSTRHVDDIVVPRISFHLTSSPYHATDEHSVPEILSRRRTPAPLVPATAAAGWARLRQLWPQLPPTPFSAGTK